jgi:predicted RNA binding protein YcfA (HicA-like mRNA interferase family)
MSKLKLIDAKTMDELLLKLEFKAIRQKGCHVFYRYQDGRTTTIPFHVGKELARPLIRQILNEIKISVEEYNELLNNL